MAKDQAFWDRVDDELRENEHIMATKVRHRRNFRNEVRPEASLKLPNQVVHQDPELWEAWLEYRASH